MNARILFTNKLMKLNILCRNLIIHHSNFFYPGIKSNALKRTLQIVKGIYASKKIQIKRLMIIIQNASLNLPSLNLTV
jgi:hypothetical protein